jgi:hypothetical protein
MKSLRFFLITFISFTSFAALAQEKLALAEPAKKKPVKVEKAFTIIEKGSLLNKATFRKDAKASGNVIEIEAVNITGGSIKGLSVVLPPATITDIISINGNYAKTRDISNSGRGVVMQLLDVNYPYRGRITVSEQILEFEITEPGFWKISVAVSQ